jgi:hypothetical protein
MKGKAMSEHRPATRVPLDENKPRMFVFVLLENFTMLSFASAVECLRIANRMEEREAYAWRLIGEGGARVRCSAGAEFTLDDDLDELRRDDTVIVCSGIDVQAATTKKLLGWLRRGKKLSLLRFTPPPRDLYRITDAASLPNGDLLLLERRYKFLSVNIRVRYVTQKELTSGRPIQGRVVMTANNSNHRVDNMEGIAVHQSSRGETIVTLVSDDNFNSFQQTLFMQFALPKNWQLAWRKPDGK